MGLSWRGYVGDAGRLVSLEHFGAPANHRRLYQGFGLTAEAVADAACESISAASRPAERPC